jgi:hypothetical protein
VGRRHSALLAASDFCPHGNRKEHGQPPINRQGRMTTRVVSAIPPCRASRTTNELPRELIDSLHAEAVILSHRLAWKRQHGTRRPAHEPDTRAPECRGGLGRPSPADDDQVRPVPRGLLESSGERNDSGKVCSRFRAYVSIRANPRLRVSTSQPTFGNDELGESADDGRPIRISCAPYRPTGRHDGSRPRGPAC